MEYSPRKIMLVEDDADIQFITRLSLEVGGGYDVRVCGSGAEALASVCEYAPDLILLDEMMPGMDGLATMDALSKLPEVAATPVVFFTANSQDKAAQEFIRRGALAVIVKPITPSALLERIRTLWR